MPSSRALRTPMPASAGLIGLAIAGPALAVDRCVATNGCTPANTYTPAQLQTALTAAGVAGSGRVLVGPGTFVAPAGGFVLSTAGSVEIVGSGSGATVIQSGPTQADYTFALRLLGGSSSVRELTVRTVHPDVPALWLGGTTSGRRVSIEGTIAATNAWGAFVEGSGSGPVLEEATVAMAGAGATAVGMYSAATLRTSTVSGERGIALSNGQDGVSAVSQVRVNARRIGVTSDAGTFTMRDSLITVSDPGATAIGAVNLNNGITPITMTYDRVTVSGTDGAAQTGVASQAGSAGGDNASVTLRNSIVTRFGVPLRRTAGPSGTATITTAFTNHAAAGVVDQNTGAGTGAIAGTSRTEHPVVFVNAPAGDYRLVTGSPLIDAGDPADTGAIDLVGGPRPRDGNGDGLARIDFGAVESPVFTPPAPVAALPALPALPAVVDRTRPRVTRLKITLVGRSARLRARISERGTLRLRIVRAGVRGARTRVVTIRSAGPVRTSFRLPAGGRYRITVTARDRAGNTSAAKIRSLRVATAPRAAR